MAETINCNYSRMAIRELCQNVSDSSSRFTRPIILQAVEQYNSIFSEQGSQMKLSANNAHNSVRQILTFFNKKWYPHGQKQLFLDIFFLNNWKELSADAKNKHTNKNCVPCHTEHALLTKSFPCKSSKRKKKS